MLRHCFLASSAHCGGECCSACYGAAACLSQLWTLRRRRREAEALKYHSASHRQVVQSPTGHCLHKIESHIELEFSLERAGVNYEPAGLKRIAKCITLSIIEKQRPFWLPSPSQADYFQDLDQAMARPTRVRIEDGIIRRCQPIRGGSQLVQFDQFPNSDSVFLGSIHLHLGSSNIALFTLPSIP